VTILAYKQTGGVRWKCGWGVCMTTCQRYAGQVVCVYMVVVGDTM
jgi:hypothetical protein